MNSPLNDLKTKGFVTIPYPEDVRVAVNEADKCWEAFYALPDEVKRSFPYSNNGAGVGYENKRIKSDSADLKENFDLTLGDREWLEEQAAQIGNETITRFIRAASKVAELIAPSVIDFAGELENEFGIEGFKTEVEESRGKYFIRFIHYFPGAEVGQEIAETHTDQSGMTHHLSESVPGLWCLSHDMKWEPMLVSEGGMTIIPSMQLQLRSEGQLKATVHNVIATPTIKAKGRRATVAFIQFHRSKKYNKKKTSAGIAQAKSRLQLHNGQQRVQEDVRVDT